MASIFTALISTSFPCQSRGSATGSARLYGQPHARLRRILLVLSIFSVIGSTVWPIGLVLGLFSYRDWLVAIVVEGFVLCLVGLFFGNYRILRQGQEARIQAQKMVNVIAFPFIVAGGMLVSLIAIGPWSSDRTIDAGRSALQLDAFLTVGWTIGFGILRRWSDEFRAIRKELIAAERHGNHEARELLLSARNQPIEAVEFLMTSIVLFIVSGTLALLVVLSGNSLVLGISVGVLLVGVGLMLLAWYTLYRSTELLRYGADTLQESWDRIRTNK